MDANLLIFFAFLISIVTAGFVVNNWIRVKNGVAPSDDWTGLAGLLKQGKSDPEKDQLIAENRDLNDKLDAVQDRMAVLERIVTDRGYSLSAEIEALRDPRSIDAKDSGIPLNIDKKENA